MIVFRVEAAEAEYLAKEFYPVCTENDFAHLPRYSMCQKLIIDGAVSESFSATSIK